jgi:hypothetical protein
MAVHIKPAMYFLDWQQVTTPLALKMQTDAQVRKP